jgi:predicted ABC-type ATPase
VPDPVLHLVVGPNGAGKSTFYERGLEPVTHLPFVNADLIARKRWPGDESAHAYEAAAVAAEAREGLVAARLSFAAETVFSHRSKLDLIDRATRAGYLITLHAILVPEDLAVLRVSERVRRGGHPVPEEKIRTRWRRLWGHVRAAIEMVEETRIYDNSSATAAFSLVALYRRGHPVAEPSWPAWAPEELRTAGRDA